MTTPQDHPGEPGQRQREHAANDALASLRAEGLEPTADTQADFQAWKNGEIPFEELERRVQQRHPAPPAGGEDASP